MVNTGELTPDLIARMEQHAVACIRTSRREPMDRGAVEAAVNFLCEQIASAPPPLIFCSSPWQALVVSVIIWLLSAKNGDRIEQGLRRDLATTNGASPAYQTWCVAWSKVEENLDVIKMIVDTSRTASGVRDQGPDWPQLLGLDLSSAFSYQHEKLRARVDEAVSDLPVQMRLQLREKFLDELRGRQPELFRDTFGQRNNWMVGNLGDQFLKQLSDDTRREVEIAATLFSAMNSSGSRLGLPDNRKPIEQVFAAPLGANLIMRLPDWFPMYSFMLQHLPIDVDENTRNVFSHYFKLKQNVMNINCSMRMCLVIEYPLEIHFNERRILHCEDGPAVIFSDGFEVYAFNGVVVRPEVIREPETLSIEKIDAERNVEIRRIMIRKFGMRRYLEESNAIVIDSDEFGILYKKEQQGDEPIVVLRVKDPTPDETGQPKEYFLRVPPYMTTAKAAVAWTFNLRTQEYEPTVQA